jgi:hypothetical protein
MFATTTVLTSDAVTSDAVTSDAVTFDAVTSDSASNLRLKIKLKVSVDALKSATLP